MRIREEERNGKGMEEYATGVVRAHCAARINAGADPPAKVPKMAQINAFRQHQA